MPTEHTFPSGSHYVLREPGDVPERIRRKFTKAQTALYKRMRDAQAPDALRLPAEAMQGEAPEMNLDESAMFDTDFLDLADEVNDQLALALLVSWTKEAPISLDAILDLPKKDYDHLRASVAPLMNHLVPDYDPTPEAGTPTTP
jgi:hypothetical protein